MYKRQINGLFHPYVELGQEVDKGQVAGVLYALEDVTQAPRELKFKSKGTVVIRRSSNHVKAGDYLFTSASIIDDQNLDLLISKSQ